MLASLLLFACNEETTTEEVNEEAEVVDSAEVATGIEGYSLYGPEEMGSIEEAENATDLIALMGEESEMDVMLSTTINEVCQKAGCWIKVSLNDSTDMRVYFKDHFTIPIETGQVDCIVQGTAYYDTISVELQQHFLEDANATQEEIDAITEPKFELAFEANAIAVKEE